MDFFLLGEKKCLSLYCKFLFCFAWHKDCMLNVPGSIRIQKPRECILSVTNRKVESLELCQISQPGEACHLLHFYEHLTQLKRMYVFVSLTKTKMP